MKNKKIGQPPKNPRLATLLHSLKLGESIRILGGDQAEIRRMVGSLNRTIKRKGIVLSYRKGSYNRNYVTALSNREMRTIQFKDLTTSQSNPVFNSPQEMLTYISQYFPGITVNW